MITRGVTENRHTKTCYCKSMNFCNLSLIWVVCTKVVTNIEFLCYICRYWLKHVLARYCWYLYSTDHKLVVGELLVRLKYHRFYNFFTWNLNISYNNKLIILKGTDILSTDKFIHGDINVFSSRVVHKRITSCPMVRIMSPLKDYNRCHLLTI